MTVEYAWVGTDPERLNKLGREGWKVIPGIVIDTALLMEREIPASTAPAFAFPGRSAQQ